MRPLFHPSIEDVTVEGVLHALADPVRAGIFTQLASTQCSRACSAFLTVDHREIPKSTLSQHMKILREAGLIRGERKGVEVQNTSRCGEIEALFPGLIAPIVRAYENQTQRRKRVRRTAKKIPSL